MLFAEVEAVQDYREPDSFVSPPQARMDCMSAPQPYPLFQSQRDMSPKKPNSGSETRVAISPFLAQERDSSCQDT